MIFRDFDDFELPFYKCEDAYKYIEKESSGEPKLVCEGFHYGEDKKICTICKKCEYRKRNKEK